MKTVAIVGRTNVGKSTLFNRLTRSRRAIVADRPGVTRDRIVGLCEWQSHVFEVIDTGGLIGVEGQLEKGVEEQIMRAIETADVLLFVVDGRDGLVAGDHEIAEILRKIGKPLFLAVNKIDGIEGRDRAADFYSLGLGEPIPISGMHGFNMGDFLDALCELLPESGHDPELEAPPRICIVGKPNVGKSSLLNAIIGETRAVVSDEPGTTRDSVDQTFEFNGRPITLVDTAGLRRRARVDDAVEYYSGLRARETIKSSEVALFMLDATQGWSHQDKTLLDEIVSAGKGLLILVNKWDLMERELVDAAEFLADMRDDMRFVDFAPASIISATTGMGVRSVLDLALGVRDRMMQTIPGKLLDDIVFDAVTRMQPAAGPTGRPVKFFKTRHEANNPFVVRSYVNEPGWLGNSYRRFLQNRLREVVDLEGVMVLWGFRKMKRGKKAR